jgi:hypothetical protein
MAQRGETRGFPCITFSYVDVSEPSTAGFTHHLKTYQQLLAILPDFQFLYLSDSTVNFPAAERAFRTFASRALTDDRSTELLHYFALRARWDKKQYGSFSNDELEWLNEGNARFRGEKIDRLYAAWCLRESADDAAGDGPARSGKPRKFRFTPCLVSTEYKTSKEPG